MTSTYKDIPPITIGLSCARGTEIPTWARLGAPATRRRRAGTVVVMIEIHALTKTYGSTTAVADLTFTVRPGVVTGFLGPNGAGKSTTMRMILGLDEPTSGSVLVNGRAPRSHAAPLHEIGGMLDPRAVHPSRSAYHHLLAIAQTSGIRKSRVDDVIDAVGLRPVGEPAGRQVLARHEPAAGHRGRAARRPRHGGARRAGQRPGRRRHQVDPGPAVRARGPGQDRVRVLAPDERDRPDRDAPDRHRPRPADRGHRHRRVHGARPRRPRSGSAAPIPTPSPGSFALLASPSLPPPTAR